MLPLMNDEYIAGTSVVCLLLSLEAWSCALSSPQLPASCCCQMSDDATLLCALLPLASTVRNWNPLHGRGVRIRFCSSRARSLPIQSTESITTRDVRRFAVRRTFSNLVGWSQKNDVFCNFEASSKWRYGENSRAMTRRTKERSPPSHIFFVRSI